MSEASLLWLARRFGSLGVGRLSPLWGDLLFFACAKKRRQKKARPDVRAAVLWTAVPGRSAVLGAGFHTTSLSCGSLSRPSWPLTPARGAESGAAIGAPESKATAKAPSPPSPSPARGRGEKGGALPETHLPSPRPRGEGARRADEGQLLLLTLNSPWAAPSSTARAGASGPGRPAQASARQGCRVGAGPEHVSSAGHPHSGCGPRGVLSFACFSLHKQRKVGRLTRRKASHTEQTTKASCNSQATAAHRTALH